jgi:hypothetical protein
MGRPLSFLMNDRGELYSPNMRDPQAWARHVASDAKDNMYGTDFYGNAKERVRSRTQQLSELKARQRAWTAYDKAVEAGNAALPPKVPRPEASELAGLLKDKTKAVSGLKRFLARVQEDAGKTRTGEIVGSAKNPRARWTPTSDNGFFGGETTRAHNFERELGYITGKADRQEALAKRFEEMAAKNPKFKQIAQELRMTDGERWDRLAKNLESRGVKTPTQKRTIEALFEAAGGNPAALPKSKLFKPRQFETFVPSLLHGGMSATNSGTTPLDYILQYGPGGVKDVGNAWWQGGFQGARKAVDQWLDDYKYNTSSGRSGVSAETIKQLKTRPQLLVPASGDNIYKHTVTEGSSQNPRGFYRDPKITPVGRKPTLWLRIKDQLRGKFTDEEFLRHAKRMGVDPYAGSSAGQTAAGEVMGLNRFRRMFGGGCRGGHCGGGPARLYGRLLKGQFPGDPNTYLPNRVALSDIFEPLLVTNKAQALKDLTKGFRGRVGAGVGAIGLMGAAGYGLTGLGQSLLRSPKLPPQPKLDPHMFAKAMTLLKPPQQQA